ncbi:MAG: hypothetical protein K0V04_33040 [Deltaproteobacteria bacterium]|nr:hypothetical protein [Deltaproteobacteria bacterium]
MNSQFAAYTRSTAFSMSLSAKMIDRLVSIWHVHDVATRYDWWEPPATVCATGEASTSSQTDAALTRRGLLEHDTDRLADFGLRHDGQRVALPTVKLTEPGILTAQLVIAAGFQPTKARIGFGGGIDAHPDDCDHLGGRHEGRMVWLTNADGSPGDCNIEPIELPRDRRLDLWEPGDEIYYEHMSMKDMGELNNKKIDAERAARGETGPRPEVVI